MHHTLGPSCLGLWLPWSAGDVILIVEIWSIIQYLWVCLFQVYSWNGRDAIVHHMWAMESSIFVLDLMVLHIPRNCPLLPFNVNCGECRNVS